MSEEPVPNYLEKTRNAEFEIEAEKLGYFPNKGFGFTIINRIENFDIKSLRNMIIKINGMGCGDEFVTVGGHAAQGVDPHNIPVGERYKIVVRSVANQVILR